MFNLLPTLLLLLITSIYIFIIYHIFLIPILGSDSKYDTIILFIASQIVVVILFTYNFFKGMLEYNLNVDEKDNEINSDEKEE